ncbi:MAG TPA: hypothetical protein VKD71_08995 [Gemmataceae bacterium]|nr:hypothetical protein [Gemmataceae bacterium]
MRTLVALLAFSVFVVAGCVPMKSGPLPSQLLDDDQRRVDDCWERALTPIDRLEREPFLDALIITQGYQLGVDRLHLRSEKDFSSGVVVMEIRITRKRPVDDRFEVSVLDKNGKVLRDFMYSREEVERVQRELRQSKYACKDSTEPLENDYEIRKRAEIQARLKAVADIFPQMDELDRKVEEDAEPGK